MMSTWIKVDLRSGCPAPGRLVALKMNDGGKYRYDIGWYESEKQTGRKLWWHGTCGISDAAKMKDRYGLILWCAIPE